MILFEQLVGLLLFLSAVLVGTFTGSLHDPLFILMLVASAVAGAARLRWWVIIAIALGFAALRAGIAYPRYVQIGADPWPRLALSFAMNSVIIAATAAIGRLLVR